MKHKSIIVMVLFFLVSLTVACWCQPAGAYSLKVKAWIDGRSQLIIRGNTVQWHNLSFNAPGYENPYGDPPAPTYLTTKDMKTVAWTPGDWSNGTSDDTTSDKFTSLSAPLAAVDQSVTLKANHVRDTAAIVQQPDSGNGYTLIVEFNDEESSSAYWYQVTLDYVPGIAFQLMGVLNGMTNSEAYAVNGKGQATGESWDTGYANSRAFLWDPKTKVMQDLGTPAEWPLSSGSSINTKGQVAGLLVKPAPGPSHVFFWDPKSGMQDLGNLGGTNAWVAWHSGINDKGQLCGSSETPPDNGPWHAFFWDPKTKVMQDLGTLPGGTYSEAYAINSKGQVVGKADTGGQDHAFLWDPKTKVMQDLGTLPGGTWSHAYAINSKGQVVGDSTSSSGQHAFFWDPKTKVMQDLGILPGGTWSYASWINDKGRVVGRADTGGQKHAFFWDPKIGNMVDLGVLAGGTGSEAWSINSNGQVVGRSDIGGQEHGFFWDPTSMTMRDLGTLSDGIESGADDINSKGQVAGYVSDADGYQQAVIWKP